MAQSANLQTNQNKFPNATEQWQKETSYRTQKQMLRAEIRYSHADNG